MWCKLMKFTVELCEVETYMYNNNNAHSEEKKPRNG